MSADKLIRWSGLCLVLGGISIVLYNLLVESVGGIAAGASAVLTSTWLLGQSFHFVGAILTLFGVVGLYAQQRERSGGLGLVGFIIAFIGTALFVGAGMVQAYILPSVVEKLPNFVERTGPWFSALPILGIFALSDLSRLLGYLLLGIAIIRVGELPRWGAVTLIIGAVLANLPPIPVLPTVVRPIGSLLFGAGLAWLGYVLWSAKGKMTATAKLAT